MADLKSDDPARQHAALDAVKKAAGTRGHGFNGPLALDVLLKAGRFAEAEQMAFERILADASDATYVGGFQKVRVWALLGQGKKDEALAASKGYYNVAPLAQSQDAVNLVASCLATARPKEAGLGPRFLRQQVAWASAEPGAETQPASDVGAPILPTIQVDGKPYEQAIDAIISGKVKAVASKGNLLLLADRPAEARDLFELALNSAHGHDATWMIESVARAIRAQKGCVAPANAYVLSMRQGQE